MCLLRCVRPPHSPCTALLGVLAGSFSFPAVPPDTHLDYEVQLVDWEPAGEEPPREQML